MALRQPPHGLPEPAYLHVADDRFGNVGRCQVLHEASQFGGVLSRAEGFIEARGIGQRALEVSYPLDCPPQAPRDLLVGRLAAKLGGEPIVGAGHLAHLFTHVHGQPYGAALVRHSPSDSLPYPPRGVGGEPPTAIRVELLDGLHQSYVALLDEILEGHPISSVPLGYRYHEPQVLLDEPPARLGVPSISPLGEVHLFCVSQQCALVDAGKVARKKLRRLRLPGGDAFLSVMHHLAFSPCEMISSQRVSYLDQIIQYLLQLLKVNTI